MSNHLNVSHFEGSILCAALGDTIGYKNGDWEFNKNTKDILKQASKLGGILAFPIDQWILSDDTIMHLATMETLNILSEQKILTTGRVFVEQALFRQLCDQYVACLDDMRDRAPGDATLKAKKYMLAYEYPPYNPRGGGNGAAMRTMCIGLFLPHYWQKTAMIKTAIVASRVTHNNPVAILGGVVSALFTSYAIKNLPIHLWAWMMLHQDMPTIEACLTEMNLTQEWQQHNASTQYFINMWKEYMRLRFPAYKKLSTMKPHTVNDVELLEVQLQPSWPSAWLKKSELRDDMWRQFQFSDWYGSSGHDAVIIAYDAVLFTMMMSNDGGLVDDPEVRYHDYKTLMTLAALHEGDSDSTASIAGAWFGAYLGTDDIPTTQMRALEYYKRLLSETRLLFNHSKIMAL